MTPRRDLVELNLQRMKSYRVVVKYPRPGEALALALSEHDRTTSQPSSKLGIAGLNYLAEKVRGLDYTQAWAVVYALKHYERQGHRAKPGEEWWTAAWRGLTWMIADARRRQGGSTTQHKP